MAIPKPNANVRSLDPQALERHAQNLQATTQSHPAIVSEFEALQASRLNAPIYIDPNKVLITDMANRDPQEFETEDFKIFMADIEKTKGNIVPAAVYLLEKPTEEGHTHGLIYGHCRTEACKRTHQKLQVLVEPKPTVREQFSKMVAENDARSKPSSWAQATWIAKHVKSFDSVRQMSMQTNMPEATIYRYVRVASLDERAISLLASRLEIQLESADKLISFKDKHPEDFEANIERLSASGQKYDFKTLCRELTVTSQKKAPKETSGTIKDPSGNEFATVKVNRSGELRVVVQKCTEAEHKSMIKFLATLRK